MKFASVLLDLSIDKTFDYSIPEELQNRIVPGSRVSVPFRGREQAGFVIAFKDQPEVAAVKPITNVLRAEPVLKDELLQLALWMSKYYCTPFHKVIKTIVPASLRTTVKPKEQLFVMRAKTSEELSQHCVNIRSKHPGQAAVLDCMLQTSKGILLSELLEKSKASRSSVNTLIKNGWLKSDLMRLDRSPLVNEEYLPAKPKILNVRQKESFDKIVQSLNQGGYQTQIIYGITGSGKTEVYLQAIQEAIKLGKGVIVLVPEIALTAQTIERFRSRFEGQIAVLHHRLSHGERLDEWERISRGDAKIVIGARSAVFSPVVNLGLIIVDEEHENSYKQAEEMPCYHARDVAVMRGKMANATVVLGSATPSLESYYNAKKEKYQLSKLTERPDLAHLPKVTIVDMNREREKAGHTNFSEALLEGIKRRIEAGEQTILFLNRRGYHTTLKCMQCQETVKCRHCDLSLTFHKDENTLSCHLCGFTQSPLKTCPRCKSSQPLKFRGTGTEQIDKALHAIFPHVRTLRMDADTTRHKGSHQMLFRAFASGKADVLIGTQMIAKGLHFPAVTLVGVLNSDQGLNIPDFRASEITFQLITQVSGRAGRGAMTGEVIIQTYVPDNRTIQLAAKQDYEGFFHEELAVRELFRYPPYSQMAKIVFSGEKADQVLGTGEQVLSKLKAALPSSYEFHPLIPAGHSKVKDKYFYQFILRGPNVSAMVAALSHLMEQFRIPKAVKVRIDINPTSTFF